MAFGELVLSAAGEGMRGIGRAFAERLAARLAGRAAPPRAIVLQPEPRAIGSAVRASQYLAGNFPFAGHLVQHRGSPWDIAPPDRAFADAMHGFAWVDDLAAAGDVQSRNLLRSWLGDWLRRYGRGSGPGWRPDLAGRRLTRWITHAPLFLKGTRPAEAETFFRALGRHRAYLARRAASAESGLPRFEALTGLVCAALAFEEEEGGALAAALKGFGAECAASIAADGGIASRDPEELAEIFARLVWVARTLGDAGRDIDPRLSEAIERVAPTLRTLRMGHGGLARFHGGGPGAEGLLDQALADAHLRAPARTGPAMGFTRLAAGRTVCIVDTAPPPRGAASLRAHASTLGFELSSGRLPILGSVGAGEAFGAVHARSARETAAHSTVVAERTSSARFLGGGVLARFLGPRIVAGPVTVPAERADDINGAFLLASHDGYLAEYGLLHERRLFLSLDGRDLRGEDTVQARTDAQKRSLDRRVASARQLGAGFVVVFHVHPEVEAKLGLGGTAVSLRLATGDVWVFRQSGGTLELLDATWLDAARLNPRATRRIVVTGRVMRYRGQVSWALKRADEAQPPRDGRADTTATAPARA